VPGVAPGNVAGQRRERPLRSPGPFRGATGRWIPSDSPVEALVLFLGAVLASSSKKSRFSVGVARPAAWFLPNEPMRRIFLVSAIGGNLPSVAPALLDRARTQQVCALGIVARQFRVAAVGGVSRRAPVRGQVLHERAHAHAQKVRALGNVVRRVLVPAVGGVARQGPVVDGAVLSGILSTRSNNQSNKPGFVALVAR
jgi:hypothetical protein